MCTYRKTAHGEKSRDSFIACMKITIHGQLHHLLSAWIALRSIVCSAIRPLAICPRVCFQDTTWGWWRCRESLAMWQEVGAFGKGCWWFRKLSEYYCWWFRSPKPPPGMYKTLWILGCLLHQLVQDFFHQQYFKLSLQRFVDARSKRILPLTELQIDMEWLDFRYTLEK